MQKVILPENCISLMHATILVMQSQTYIWYLISCLKRKKLKYIAECNIQRFIDYAPTHVAKMLGKETESSFQQNYSLVFLLVTFNGGGIHLKQIHTMIIINRLIYDEGVISLDCSAYFELVLNVIFSTILKASLEI